MLKEVQNLRRTFSLKVKRTAHNGKDVGSNPT